MKEIPLSSGMVALVDDEDFEKLSKFKWSVSKSGSRFYAYRIYLLDGKKSSMKMHRFLMNALDGFDVDHINHNTLDNRKSNLRVCSRSKNLANSSVHSDRIYDLPKGVEYSKGRSSPYLARICCNGIRHYLGRFKTVEEASKAYIKKAKELFGEYAFEG